MKNRILCLWITAGASCAAAPDAPEVTPAPDPAAIMPDPAPVTTDHLNFYVGQANGRRAFVDTFARKEGAYLDAVLGEVPADGPRPPGVSGDGAPAMLGPSPEGDYVYAVFDRAGALASLDVLACRKIHVSAAGVIDRVYAGASGCQHAQATDTMPYGKGGGLTVQLAPFADSEIGPGPFGSVVMLYDLKVVRAEQCNGGFPTTGPVAGQREFFVWPPTPAPVCGNGVLEGSETCDDGNTADGDGCSATCTIEPPVVCGDGVVSAGEQCDDGNTAGGDGCSATCTIEPPPSCGNGVVEPGEQCDDGNLHDGDGCSSCCHLE